MEDWNTVEISLQRKIRRASGSIVRRSCPLYSSCPEVIRAVGVRRFRMALPRVDLPEPDSPSSPTTSPE